jgi:hypothetical protein
MHRFSLFWLGQEKKGMYTRAASSTESSKDFMIQGGDFAGKQCNNYAPCELAS